MSDSLDAMRADWRLVARYSVYRTQIGSAKVLLHSGLDYETAMEKVKAEDSQIRAEPGYRGHVMDRPKGLMQLEEPDATQQRFREVRASRRKT